MEFLMRMNHKKLDIFLTALLILIIVGFPTGILVYDHMLWSQKISPEAKQFTLTGHTDRGWILGDVRASDVISLWKDRRAIQKPVIEVSQGDTVVFKLKSADVVHGFSFQEAQIFINDGIQPGKVIMVTFQIDKVGSFTFSCNSICGDNHQNMQGILIVKPRPPVRV